MHFYAATSFFGYASPVHDEHDRVGYADRQEIMSERLPPPRLGRTPRAPPTPAPSKPTDPAAAHVADTPRRPIQRERMESSPQQHRPQTDRYLDMRTVRSAANTPVSTPDTFGPPATFIGPTIVTTITAGNAPTPTSVPTTSSSSSGGGGGGGSGSGGRMSGFLHKFGAKARSSGRPGSRGQTNGNNTAPSAGPSSGTRDTSPAEKSRAESIKSSKSRARATSLLSLMARPFSPPQHVPSGSGGSGSGGGGEKSLPPTSRLSSMKSFGSLHSASPPRFDNSPPVPAVPAGIALLGSRTPTTSHPFATSLRPVDAPPNIHISVDPTTGAGVYPARHFEVTSRTSQLRPASTILTTSVSGGSTDGAGGLAPPKRPALRKRPSTADPIVGSSGRLVSRQPM